MPSVAAPLDAPLVERVQRVLREARGTAPPRDEAVLSVLRRLLHDDGVRVQLVAESLCGTLDDAEIAALLDGGGDEGAILRLWLPRVAAQADASLGALAPDPSQPATPVEVRISRQERDAMLVELTRARAGLRFVPSVSPVSGRRDGVKLYAIRPDSWAARLGIENGATLHRLNGQEVASTDPAPALRQAFRADRVELELTQRRPPRLLRVVVVVH